MKKSLKDILIKNSINNKSGLHFEVSHRRTTPIISLYLIQKDLEKAYLSIEKAVSLYEMKAIKIDNIIISALWTQAVICYTKCFTKSEDGFSKLEIRNYLTSKRALEIHEEFMNLRNSYLAHRGINNKEISLVMLNIDESSGDKEYSIPTMLQIGHFSKTYKSKLKHIKRLEKQIELRLKQKVYSLDKYLDKEFFDKLIIKGSK